MQRATHFKAFINVGSVYIVFSKHIAFSILVPPFSYYSASISSVGDSFGLVPGKQALIFIRIFYAQASLHVLSAVSEHFNAHYAKGYP